MNTTFRESFDADLSAITDAALLRRIRKVIEQVEAARTFQQILNLKRLEASGKYYRIRLGEYRLGFVFANGVVTFVRCLHRKEILPLLSVKPPDRREPDRPDWRDRHARQPRSCGCGDKFVDAFGNCPAEFLQAAFQMLRPVQNFIQKPIDFYEHMHDEKYLEDFLTTET